MTATVSFDAMDHCVQFYENDAYLIDQIGEFFDQGMAADDVCIVIATPPHRDALQVRRGARSHGMAGAHRTYIALDAATTLRSFMVDGWPDEGLFYSVMDRLFGQFSSRPAKRIKVFGEMVALLHQENNTGAAIQLEKLWNALADRYSFSLLCAYPMNGFGSGELSEPFRHICATHSHVYPTESYVSSNDSRTLYRTIAALQQRAFALESEVARRRAIEVVVGEKERRLTERSAELERANALLVAEINKRKAIEQNLLHAQDVMNSAQQVAHMGSWEFDAATRKLNCSDEYFRIYGLSPQELELDLDLVHAMVHPDDRQTVRDAILATWATKGEYKSEKRIVRRDGTVRHVVSRGSPVLNERQELVRIIGYTLDITERKQIEQKLKESEERFRSLVNLSSDGYWEQDAQMRFVKLSAHGAHKIGVEASSLLKRTRWDLNANSCDEESRARLEANFRRREPFYDFEYSFETESGAREYLQTSGEPIFDGNGGFLGYRGVAKVITAQRMVEEALRKSQSNLQELAAHQEQVKEEERKRIAREVHDELGGLLTGIKAYLSVCADRAAGQDDTMDKLLADAADLTDRATDAVRKIITDLRPSVLDQLGLSVALQWYADEVMERTGLKCSCAIDPEIASLEIDPERSIAVFRIVQEALTNVVRHAQASSVSIHARQSGNFIVLTVEDDGKGIEADHLLNGQSWGLKGMYERVRHFGGHLKIVPLDTRGTLVTLELPTSQSHEQSKN
jgi:PAS domain S-box-containing protein